MKIVEEKYYFSNETNYTVGILSSFLRIFANSVMDLCTWVVVE